MKTEMVPAMGGITDAAGSEDYSLDPEEFLDRNFGVGAWTRDPYDDVFIVVDIYYRGPGRCYIVIDRDLRRVSTTIPASMVN